MEKLKISRKKVQLFFILLYLAFIALSYAVGYNPGKEIGSNFFTFCVGMIKVLPCAFILIGLFEVWVKKERVERHLGHESGFQGYFWAVLLASSTVGGLYVAFPVAYSLFRKGARLSVIFTYIGSAGICRIPMTIFEASFMGAKFSLIRLVVSVPLVILSSIWLEKYLANRNYSISDGK